MARKRRLDPYHWHEALDRAFLATEWFEEFVASHPVVKQTPELRRRAEQVADHLADFYQAVGAAVPETDSVV